MKISESCATCLYDKQVHKVNNQEYLKRVKDLLDNRKETDTSAYMVYLFHQLYEEMFGISNSYAVIKKEYNDFVLGVENEIREKIRKAENPLKRALQYARIGNYIDFGAMNHVDKEEFFSLLEEKNIPTEDELVYQSLQYQLEKADNFLLITDNCGEIVLDKLFVEQVKKKYPKLAVNVLVRGGEVLNDATMEDASYVGMCEITNVIDSGINIAGTVYELISDNARKYIDDADVILAKGQGNYETLSGTGRHIFYSFLCKCDLFMERFHVPRLTGLLVEEV